MKNIFIVIVLLIVSTTLSFAEEIKQLTECEIMASVLEQMLMEKSNAVLQSDFKDRVEKLKAKLAADKVESEKKAALDKKPEEK